MATGRTENILTTAAASNNICTASTGHGTAGGCSSDRSPGPVLLCTILPNRAVSVSGATDARERLRGLRLVLVWVSAPDLSLTEPKPFYVFPAVCSFAPSKFHSLIFLFPFSLLLPFPSIWILTFSAPVALAVCLFFFFCPIRSLRRMLNCLWVGFCSLICMSLHPNPSSFK